MDDASPRFRQDLEAVATEAEGVACVDVRDPQTGTNFRFYDFEYQLALQFNGQPLRDVVTWAAEAYGVDLTVDGINEFAGRLSELGFLEPAAAAPAALDTTPPMGTKLPPEALDNPEAEWMSAEGAKTATFIPDLGMLDAPSELTPVAPELPMDAEAIGGPPGTTDESTPPPEPASTAHTKKTAEMPTPPPRLFDIPSAGAPKPTPPASEALPAPAPPALKGPTPPGANPAPNWAMDLDGTLQTEGEPRRPTPPALGAASNGAATKDAPNDMTPPPTLTAAAGLPPTARPSVPAAPPTGLERRQPPAPDAVQMTAFSDDAARVKPKSRGVRIVGVIILVLVIAGIVYAALSYEKAHNPPTTVRVRVLSPRPAAVYRWFSGPGTVTDHEARTLAFDSSGMLADLLPPGTAFVAGDIIARLRGAQPIEALLSRYRARLAFHQQMRDSMRTANNQAELRQAELRLAEKQRLVDDTTASLAKLVVRAGEPGEVVETLAKVGTFVRTNAPLVRVKGRMLHGEFELDAEEIAGVAALAFCRVEVVGLGPRASNPVEPPPPGTAADVGSPEAQAVPRFIDCTVEKSGGRPGKKLRVALPDNLGLVPGQPLRLARQRYDAVFPIPAGAVSGAGDHRSIWVANAAGTAERRDIVVADVGDDALVSDGLRIGEEVILDAPADLRAGAPITIQR
jgi:multidrug efflux pump subunit AcrA (membrane-fusion protein)